MRKIIFLLIIHGLFPLNLLAEIKTVQNLFREIVLQVDSGSFSNLDNSVTLQNEQYIWFRYAHNDEVCNVKLYPNAIPKNEKLFLKESGDFSIIDSISSFNGSYYEFKVRFQNLTKSDFLKFTFLLKDSTISYNCEVKLMPVTKTTVQLNQNTDELAVGEEKAFSLLTDNPFNVNYSTEWNKSQDINYRISENNGQLLIHLLAVSTGRKVFQLELKSFKPDMESNILKYKIPATMYTFNVKSAGLAFLNPDKSDIPLEDYVKTNGIDIQMDYNRLLQLNTTYYIENQENFGGVLIGTLYVREKLSNNKVLCTLRAFNFHKQSEGYLYIKDSYETKFITNFNLIPKTTIDRVRIMRNGTDWKDDQIIYPGETINLRIEGQSLSKAKFNFDGLINLGTDSLIKNDNLTEYKIKVPLDINKKSIDIFNYNQSTGKTLTVKEFQNARPFDYINVSYGKKCENIIDLKSPDLYDGPIKDINLSFSADKIDTATKLYGKQYFDIDVKIFNDKGELTDYCTINDVAICPGEKSPRYAFYDKSDCSKPEISINSKINNPIYNLKDWSKVRLTFKNQNDKYTKDSQNKTIEIVLQSHVNFDIDVSFPAGLLIKKAKVPGFGNFSGISMAVIAQFSFYKENKIAQPLPYKIGAGFLALNAFNFNQDASGRDMGLVILGSINPVNTNRKLKFPIYLGCGYLLSQKRAFWLIGPGISVSF